MDEQQLSEIEDTLKRHPGQHENDALIWVLIKEIRRLRAVLADAEAHVLLLSEGSQHG